MYKVLPVYVSGYYVHGSAYRCQRRISDPLEPVIKWVSPLEEPPAFLSTESSLTSKCLLLSLWCRFEVCGGFREFGLSSRNRSPGMSFYRGCHCFVPVLSSLLPGPDHANRHYCVILPQSCSMPSSP